jgi:protein ImuB
VQRPLSLHLPTFAVDLARRSAHGVGAHVVWLLVESVASRQLVAACCARAAGAGVRPGMTVAQARALAHGEELRLEPRDPAREQRALERLGHWALRFSPVVALDPPDGLLLDVVGCARLFGGEEALAQELLGALARLGLTGRAALAGTIGCAWGLARHARGPLVCVADGDEERALAGLPIDALRLAPDVLDALLELGVERVGQLLDLPRDELPARFGPQLVARIDQALGRADEPRAGLQECRAPRVSRVFEGPVADRRAIELSTRELLAELCDELALRAAGTRRVDVELVPSDAAAVHLVLATSRLRRDAEGLWELLAPRLEGLRVGSTGIERITLWAPRTARLRPRQRATWTEDGDGLERPLAELLDALDGRLGAQSTRRAWGRESHLPERAFTTLPFLERAGERARIAPAERPTQLLAAPEPARVAVTRAGLPRELRWRGRAYAVVHSEGPERLSRPWWEVEREAPGARDYHRVACADGSCLWVFREVGTRAWFVHGEWS